MHKQLVGVGMVPQTKEPSSFQFVKCGRIQNRFSTTHGFLADFVRHSCKQITLDADTASL